MASIISELRSVTFQSQSTTLFVSEINIKKHKMAPQHETLPKSSDFEVEQSQKSSPVSNLGTSLESSPPVLSNEETSETIKQNKFDKIEDPSSNDSGSIQNYQVNQGEYQSPLMRLQSALKKDGRLGKKLCPPISLSKTPNVNSWMPSTPPGIFERNLPTSSTGIADRNISSSVMYHNNLTSSSEKAYTSMPTSMASNCNIGGQLVSAEMYQGSLPSTSTGIYHESIESNSNTVFDPNNTFSCRVCDFTCFSKIEYDSHMNLHYTHKCPHCNYSSRTEGRLKRHVKEFHSDTPPESWAGTRTPRTEMSNSEQLLDNSVTSSNGKARTFRCKHCSFVAYQKSDFWKHSKTHIKPDKLLQCEQCDFVTEFKHHYEYHIANHAGRKPFQCSMCNYKCVNKSMLNSHLKSHSNVYQFHCADCKYETKYCHSIKQHLKKQNHKPGIVLNQDGSPCPFQVIDVYGRRRGPRAKKRKSENTEDNCMALSVPSASQQTSVPTNHQSIPFSTAVSLLRPNIPTLYPPFYGDYSPSLMMRTSPQLSNSGFSVPMSVSGRSQNCFACTLCPFITQDKEMLKRHMVLHIASENQDIAKLYGINPDFFHDQQMALNSDANGHRNCTDSDENDKKLFSTAAENSFGFQDDFRSYKREREVLLDDQNVKSEDGSSPKYRRISSPMNDENDSFKEYSSPSPLGSSSHSPDFVAYEKKDSENMEETSFMITENRMEDNESPIDLSGRKSSDSLKLDKTNGGLETQISEHDILAASPKMESSNVSSSSQRNRRKGRAYKINHYVQYDEQSSHQEFVKENNKQNTLDTCKSSITDDVKQSCKEQSQNLKEALDFSDKSKNNETSKAPNNHSDSHNEQNSPSNLCADSFVYSPKVSNRSCSTSSADNDTRVVKDVESFIEHTALESSAKSDKPTNRQAKSDNSGQPDIYECHHCDIIFRDLAMYSVHMGYHGYMNPFQCNLCGQVTASAVEFFVHIARVSHI